MAKIEKQKKEDSYKAKSAKERPHCGLCGKKRKLTRTECCGQWICDDEDQYVLFSYAQNSCYRNHDSIRSVRFITMKNTRVIGKSAKNAGMILKLKYMYGMEPTSIILKDLRIPLSMSRHGAQGAEKSST